MRARAGQHQVFTSPGRGSRRAGAVRGARREGIALPKSGATTRPFPNGPNWVRSARSPGGHIGMQIRIPLDLASLDRDAEFGSVRPFFHRFPARWSPPRLGSFGQFFADFPRDDPRRARPAIGFVRPEFRDSPRVETSELRRSGGRQDPLASYDQRGTARYFMILEIISKIFAGWGEEEPGPIVAVGLSRFARILQRNRSPFEPRSHGGNGEKEGTLGSRALVK